MVGKMATVCNICTDRLCRTSEDISAVPCGHVFHRICLDKWWANNQTCPNCRTQYPMKIDKLYLENFEEEIEKVKLLIVELQSTLQRTEEEKTYIQSKLENEGSVLTNEVETHKRNTSALKIEILKNTETVNSLQADIAEKTSSLEVARSTINKYKVDNELMSANLHECRGYISVLEDDILGSRTEISRLQSTVDEKTQLLHVAISTISKYKDENAALYADLQEFRTKISVVEGKICRAKVESSNLYAEASKTRQLLQVARHSLNELQSESDEKLATSFDEMKTLQVRVENYASENAKLRMSLEKYHSTVMELEIRVAKLQQTILLHLCTLVFLAFCALGLYFHLNLSIY